MCGGRLSRVCFEGADRADLYGAFCGNFPFLVSCPAAALVRNQARKQELQLLDITLPGVDFRGGDLKGVGPVDVTSLKVRGLGKLSEKGALGLGPVMGRKA